MHIHNKERKAMSGEQGRKYRTGRKRQAEQRGRTKLPGQDCLERTARKGLPGPGCQDRTAKTGLPGQVCQDRDASTD